MMEQVMMRKTNILGHQNHRIAVYSRSRIQPPTTHGLKQICAIVISNKNIDTLFLPSAVPGIKVLLLFVLKAG